MELLRLIASYALTALGLLLSLATGFLTLVFALGTVDFFRSVYVEWGRGRSGLRALLVALLLVLVPAVLLGTVLLVRSTQVSG